MTNNINYNECVNDKHCTHNSIKKDCSEKERQKLGEWKSPTRFSLMFVCSECGRDGCFIRKRYCPNCGAKMNIK